MQNLIIFLFGTSGLVFILNKSSMFKPIREYITKKHYEKQSKNRILGFFSDLFSCSLCMGFWASIPMFLIIYNDLHNKMILPLMMCGALVSYLISSISEMINRK